MEFEEITLKIPCGYKIIEKNKTIDLFTANELLKSKRQRHYTKAVRDDNNITIFWHSIRCPYCGKETPAYYHYLSQNNQYNKISAKPIALWTKPQLSIFENEKNALYLQTNISLNTEFECQKCGNSSVLSDTKTEIKIGCNKNHIYISRKIKNFDELLQLKWPQTINCIPIFPLEEQILFNLNNGTIEIQLLDKNSIIYSFDITNIEFPSNIGVLEEAINKNIVVKRVLKRFFEKIWQEKLPFSKEELSLHKFSLMTKFVDFPRDFFDAIPFAENSNTIYFAFLDIAKKLHTPISAIELLKNSKLPNVKSLKRIFTAKSGLFFYLEECTLLYDILNDINLLCKILTSNTAFVALAMLHKYPSVKLFYKEFSKIKTPLKLCDHIIYDLEKLNNQAILYNALSEWEKQLELKRWQENNKTIDNVKTPFITYMGFSTIMCPFPEDIKDCIIDSFRFKWLKNTAEYQEAGRKLHNCLTEWNHTCNPVIAIYENKKIIAAMEICDKTVVQALQKYNEKIDRMYSFDLYSAIEKWSQKYSIEISDYCWGD